MNSNEFDMETLVLYLEREYGLERSVILSLIEESILKSARKNPMFTNDLRVIIDRNELKVRLFDTFVVSDDDTGPGLISSKLALRYNKGVPLKEGDLIEIEIPAEKLGRVCARESRMLILQKIKMARNFNIVNTYKNRIGDIINGVVTGIEKGNVIITVNGKTDMVIPRSERIPRENLKIGDSVKGLILGVNEKQKHSPIVVSRACNRFLEELMKREISELADGTLEIMSIKRNPGFRAKVSVRSSNKKVDPVGSCIGKRGMRINMVINELSGEKIDVVRYSDNITEYVKEALSPTKPDSVEIDENDPNVVNVTVDSNQYASVIGRFGGNIKLASELVGKRIVVRKSIETMSFEEQKEHAINELSDILSISKVHAERVVNSGFLTPLEIATEDVETFIASTGIEEVSGRGIHAAACAVIQASIYESDEDELI